MTRPGQDGYHLHVIPDMAFDARSAEYNIPRSDIDAILDMILHEPYIPDPVSPENHADDPALKAGHYVAAVSGRDRAVPGTDVPVWLFNAPTIQAAKDAHMARVDHCKKHVVHVLTRPGDAMDVIRKADSDPSRVNRIREQVSVERRRLNL